MPGSRIPRLLVDRFKVDEGCFDTLAEPLSTPLVLQEHVKVHGFEGPRISWGGSDTYTVGFKRRVNVLTGPGGVRDCEP